jgi:hypothetical protein
MKETFDLMKRVLLGSYTFHGRLKQFIKGASDGQILFHKKGDLNEKIVELDVNSLYGTAMTKIKVVMSKPKVIFDNNLMRLAALKVFVDIESLIEKCWSRFKVDNRYPIDNIAYFDLIQYQNAKLKVICGIYWDSGFDDSS